MCFGNKILLRVLYPLAFTNIKQHKAIKTNEAFMKKSYSKMKLRSSLLSNGEFYYMLPFYRQSTCSLANFNDANQSFEQSNILL